MQENHAVALRRLAARAMAREAAFSRSAGVNGLARNTAAGTESSRAMSAA